MNHRKRLEQLRQNKRGNIVGIIVFFFILMLILFIGFIAVIGSSVVNFVFDTTVPELTGLGQIGDANFTEISEVTINPLNNVVQNATWLTGVLYVLMLVGSIGFAMGIKTAPNKWLIGFYFMLTLILIMTAIFVSNMYEEFYGGTDDFSAILREHTILSFMILYSPTIFTAIAFMTGIVLFSGMQEDEV